MRWSMRSGMVGELGARLCCACLLPRLDAGSPPRRAGNFHLLTCMDRTHSEQVFGDMVDTLKLKYQGVVEGVRRSTRMKR